MEQFVCVRLVQANVLDLRLFQFDYDLTFSAFFLNADKVLYGRFGSRSERADATKDISIEAFRKALVMALQLHREYPANKALFAHKTDPGWPFKVPGDFPALRGKYKAELDYEGKVVQSCMHCHQVREAERLLYRADAKPIPDPVLYPWPIPDVVGLAMDPREKATVRMVTADSAAAKAGFQAGDQIVRLEGQPLLSIADVQWVLHQAPQPAILTAEVLRGDKQMNMRLELNDHWRRHTDISWRATTWDLRRMALGGMVLKDLPPEKRTGAGLANTDLSLLVEYVGEYGEHAVAKKAGFKKDDILVSVDGLSGHRSESELIGYLLQKRMPGTHVPVTVLRGTERVQFELLMQ